MSFTKQFEDNFNFLAAKMPLNEARKSVYLACWKNQLLHFCEETGTVGITSKMVKSAMTNKGVVPTGIEELFQYFERNGNENEKLIRFSSFDANKGFLSRLLDWSKGFTEDTIYCLESYMNELSQSFIHWVYEKNKGQIFDQVVLKSDLDEFNEKEHKNLLHDDWINILLSYLIWKKKIYVSTQENFQAIKISDSPITETEETFLMLRQFEQFLVMRTKFIQVELQNLRKEAKAIVKTDKLGAIRLLRKKKIIEAKLNHVEACILNVQQQLISIEQCNQNLWIFKLFKENLKTLKEGTNRDSLLSTTLLNKFVDQKDEVDDICNIINNGASGLDVSITESELPEPVQTSKRKDAEHQLPASPPAAHDESDAVAEAEAEAAEVPCAEETKKQKVEPAALAV